MEAVLTVCSLSVCSLCARVLANSGLRLIMVGKVKPYEVKPAEADATDATDATDVEGGGGGAANDAHLQKNDDNQWYYAGQSCFGKLGDALSVAVFVRPLALLTGLLWGLPHPSKYLTVLSLFFTGLLIEPLAILQDVLYWYWLRQQTFPRNPVMGTEFVFPKKM